MIRAQAGLLVLHAPPAGYAVRPSVTHRCDLDRGPHCPRALSAGSNIAPPTVSKITCTPRPPVARVSARLCLMSVKSPNIPEVVTRPDLSGAIRQGSLFFAQHAHVSLMLQASGPKTP